MRVGLSLVLTAATASVALAQPAKTKPADAPPTVDAAEAELAEFDKELDGLFVAGGLTSEQAAARAGSVSPTVERRVAEVAEQTAAATTTYLQGVPQVGGKLSYTRNSFIAPVNLPITIGTTMMNFSIPFLQNYYLAEATISIPLSDYFYRYPTLVGAAKVALEAAKTTHASALVDAGQDARMAYYEWLRAKLQVLIAQRQVAQVQATLGQVRAQAEVQRISRADELRVESQEAEAEQTADQLTNLADLREEQLRILLSVPETEKLAIGEDIRKDVAAPGAVALDELMNHVVEHRLDLKAIVEGIDARDRQRKAEVANYLPRLSLFGVADYANPNQRIFPQEDKYTGTWSVGAQVTWNLNDALTADVNKRRFEAQADELRADQENFVRQTRVQVLQAQQNVQLAVHDLETTRKGLKSAEESYRVRKELLNAERATAVELVDSETDLTRARINALNARIDLRVAIAQLVHALGDDAPHH